MVQDRNQAQDPRRAWTAGPPDIILEVHPTPSTSGNEREPVGILNDFERRLEGAVEGIFS